jgi:hypothetical protein
MKKISIFLFFIYSVSLEAKSVFLVPDKNLVNTNISKIKEQKVNNSNNFIRDEYIDDIVVLKKAVSKLILDIKYLKEKERLRTDEKLILNENNLVNSNIGGESIKLINNSPKHSYFNPVKLRARQDTPVNIFPVYGSEIINTIKKNESFIVIAYTDNGWMELKEGGWIYGTTK